MPMRGMPYEYEDEWTIPTSSPGTKDDLITGIIKEKTPPTHGGKWERFVVASDIHGDEQNVDACNALFRFINWWKPPIRICAGDVFDFRPLRKGASGDEREQSMAADYAAGRGWMDRFYGGGEQNHMNKVLF